MQNLVVSPKGTAQNSLQSEDYSSVSRMSTPIENFEGVCSEVSRILKRNNVPQGGGIKSGERRTSSLPKKLNLSSAGSVIDKTG